VEVTFICETTIYRSLPATARAVSLTGGSHEPPVSELIPPLSQAVQTPAGLEQLAVRGVRGVLAAAERPPGPVNVASARGIPPDAAQATLIY
jgi:hypothetical protein